MNLILGRPLTFGDEEQIEEIKKREIEKFLYKNKDYQKLINEISDYEGQIEKLQNYIDDTYYEIKVLKNEILRKNPYLKDFNINKKGNY